MGGSCLAQVFNQVGKSTPDLDDPKLFANFFSVINQLNKEGLIVAYHDRSDGGVIITLLEMAFASHCGLDIESSEPLSELFNEELGCVIQVSKANKAEVLNTLENAGLKDYVHHIANINKSDNISIYQQGKLVFSEKRVDLHNYWSSTSFEISKLRDNPICCLLYTSPSPRDKRQSRMPSSA